jgi:hypothetical protein
VEKSVVIGSVVRHLLTTAGGYLVSRGFIDASQVEPLAGSMLIVGGIVWSIWQKRSGVK